MEIQTHRSYGENNNKDFPLVAPQSQGLENGIISVFETHKDAEIAVKQMQAAGFDMRKLSIVARDFQTEENVIGFYNIGNRTKYWGKQGAFWGGLWGLLLGSAFFMIPGVGPVVVAGAFTSALVGAVEGIVVIGGLSALGAALYSLGIPKDTVIEFEAALKVGKYLMIAHGLPEDLDQARAIKNQFGAQQISHFSKILL